jgi:hypothetical protein
VVKRPNRSFVRNLWRYFYTGNRKNPHARWANLASRL